MPKSLKFTQVSVSQRKGNQEVEPPGEKKEKNPGNLHLFPCGFGEFYLAPEKLCEEITARNRGKPENRRKDPVKNGMGLTLIKVLS